MRDMKKRMKIISLMMLLCMSMNLMASPGAGTLFPKFKIKVVFYSAFRTHKSGCLEGFGLCFSYSIVISTDNIPQKEGYVPVGIGTSDDQSKIYLVIDSDAIQKFENGRYLNQFENVGEVVFDEDIILPSEALSYLGIDKSTVFPNRLPIKCVDGEYIIELDLK